MGLDTGGTFTDVVWQRGAERRVAKLPSTPRRPEQAFLAALEAVRAEGPGVRIHHGTTVATNAVLTRGGARVAFVTTAGFEDLPWIGRGRREDLHALAPARTAPLLARARVFGLAERMGADGAVLLAPGRAALRALRAAVGRARPEAVAVCLLHAVRNDAHERAVAEALRPLGVPIHLSADASADPREVERGTTTTLEAYVAPVLRAYLDAVAARLEDAHLTVMRSDGGRMSVAEVARAPARTLLSGPAAGVAAARALALRLGVPRALSFDVGGTSTDVAWIEGEDLAVRPALRVGPFEAGLPSVGIETVGAGGGSVAWIDAGGALRVGPRSAGAEPGPAAYGRGGPFTLTDAWLLSGHVPPALLGGDFPLDVAAAERAGRALARRAGGTLRALCAGVLEVAAVTTARALRLASVAEGRDPRHAALVAFGGAGPVLATGTAGRLGIEHVYVPADPGTFAAEGALEAPLRADASEVVTTASATALGRGVRRLGAAVRSALRAEGARSLALRVEVDARYEGQAFEVTVPYEGDWRAAFHARHAARYGFDLPERGVVPVRLRVRGEGREEAGRGSGAPAGLEPARFCVRAGRTHARADLAVGTRVRGPARLDERSGTTWVPAGWSADVLGDGTLRLRGRAT